MPEWTKKNLWKIAFEKLKEYGLLKADHVPSDFLQTISLSRLSSTNFTWYLLEYFVPYTYILNLRLM